MKKSKNKTKSKVRLIKRELDGLTGKGFLDFITNVGNKLLGSKSDQNLEYVPKSGEKHQILKKDGHLYRAKFSGPGTHVQEDITELLAKHENNISLALADENFASKVDLAALAHDLRYLLGYDVAQADKKFVEVIEKLPDKFNVIPAATIIKAKIAVGNTSAGEEELVSSSSEELMEDVLSHAKMKGYGKDRPLRGRTKCVFCGSTAKDQAAHMKTKTCINLQNEINKS